MFPTTTAGWESLGRDGRSPRTSRRALGEGERGRSLEAVYISKVKWQWGSRRVRGSTSFGVREAGLGGGLRDEGRRELTGSRTPRRSSVRERRRKFKGTKPGGGSEARDATEGLWSEGRPCIL